MSAMDERPFPRGAIIGAGALIASSLIGVGLHQYAKFTNPPAPAIDERAVVAERTLRFVGDPKAGPMSVIDAATGEKIADLKPDDGFVRVVLISMAFDRGKHGVTQEPIYLLQEWEDSRVTIEDPTTNRRVNLGAFGNENKAAFRKFLDRDS